jgi:hypothetical protein
MRSVAEMSPCRLLSQAERFRITGEWCNSRCVLISKTYHCPKDPLSEYYFKKMGDIGYLCENYNAMRDTVLDILGTMPIDRYRQQQENILTQRVQFSPAGISLKFRNLYKHQRRKWISDATPIQDAMLLHFEL